MCKPHVNCQFTVNQQFTHVNWWFTHQAKTVLTFQIVGIIQGRLHVVNVVELT